MTSHQQEVIHRLAVSIAEQRLNMDDLEVEREAKLYLKRHLMDENCYEIALQESLRINTSTLPRPTNTPKSFSLLNTKFLPPFHWEECKDESPDEILKQLSNVQYADDLAQDWKDIKAFLLTIENEHFVAIHKYLYEKTAGPEFEEMQKGIVDNVFARMKHILSNKTRVDSLPDIIALFKYMWMDWMERAVCLDAANRMGHVIWNTFLKPYKERTPAFIKYTQDSNAKWFTAWANHLSVQDVLQLVDDAYTILPMLVKRCEKTDELAWYFTCILRTILVKTRVSLFPWSVLADDTKEDAIRCVFRLFLRRLTEQDHSIVALEAIEVLLVGSKVEDSKLHNELQQELQKKLKEDGMDAGLNKWIERLIHET